jgi:hypothetical protein
MADADKLQLNFTKRTSALGTISAEASHAGWDVPT